MVYDSAYQNEQGRSATFQRHLAEVSLIVQKYFSGQKLIEVGCGKGDFMRQLQSAGFDIVGVDPTFEGSSTAVIKEYFSADLGLRGDAIVLRHVLEHVQDPVAFLRGICEANGGKGKVYIEVPCFDWICAHRAWSDITYEHVNYFRLSDFRRMFRSVLDAGHIFHGQYIYVVADLATIQLPPPLEYQNVRFPEDFAASISSYARLLQGRSNFAVWGTASKGVVFSFYMEAAGVAVKLALDINPAKQGKYLAATGIQVQSPEAGLINLQPGDDIIVMNGNYLKEVREITENRFRYLTLNE